MRIQHPGLIVVAAALLAWPMAATGEEAAPPIGGRVTGAIARAWLGSEDDQAVVTTRLATVLDVRAEQRGRAARTPAGPNIGTVGLGAIGGLSDFEIGPSMRYWVNDRVGVQAHLSFSGDDFGGPENVDFIRFEPTVIVAIGDFGDGAVNVRPYAGGGLRVVRSDIGTFSDSDVKPVAVGGVEFGFQSVPRFKVSGELSLAPTIDLDDFDGPRRGPRLAGVRVAALAHYFF